MSSSRCLVATTWQVAYVGLRIAELNLPRRDDALEAAKAQVAGHLQNDPLLSITDEVG
jgi:hypothetical protein